MSASSTSGVSGSGEDFGSMVLDGIDRLERVQDTSDQLAVKAATVEGATVADVQQTGIAFEAVAGVPYRLWIRGKARGDDYENDSVFVQFSAAVDTAGRPTFGIGTVCASCARKYAVCVFNAMSATSSS